MKRNFFLGISVLLACAMLSAQTSASGSAGANASAAASANQSGVSAQSSQSGNSSLSAASQSANASSALAEGTAINATLVKPVDAKKAKPGDEVVAKANQDVKSDGKVMIAKGSRLIGHVTEASAKSKGSAESKLGIVFDKAVSKGQEVPLHATVQAISAIQASALGSSGDDMSTPSVGPMGGGAAQGNSGGGIVGGARNTVDGVGRSATGAVNQTASGVGNVAGQAGDVDRGAVGSTTNTVNTRGSLDGTMRGVMGMPGVELNTSAAGQGASTLTSSGKNIHLDSGTQMILATSAVAEGAK
jgi:hypothetical protein